MTLVSLLSALVLCVGCAQDVDSDVGEDDEDVGEARQAQIEPNGLELNGIVLNGLELNGLELNGLELNGATLNGLELNGLELNGTSFSGTRDGVTVSGEGMEGAHMVGHLSNGGNLPIRIDDVVLASGMYRYTVSYMSSGTWQPLCGTSNGTPIQAIPLSGRWDSTATHVDDTSEFTFACQGAALAKCVDLGYKPWTTVQECNGGNCHNVSLAPLHQACTRMIRADYCGDGVAHTVNGTPVNLWDSFSIQTQASVGSGWLNEAEWGASGALCIGDVRHDLNDATSDYIDAHCPSRWNSLSTACFSNSSTFFTQYGYSTSISARPVIRNMFDYNYVQQHGG